jgi:hypothetical protein
MNLKHLTDTTLHTDTLRLVTREREMTAQILHHLKENARRKLFSDHKCSSLFSYCVTILGYSESAAQRRIEASRLLAEIPEIEEKIEQGSLSLTNIGQVSKFIKDNNIRDPEQKKAVLLQVEDMSKAQCEQTLFGISGLKKPAREGVKRISKDESKVSYILSDETRSKVEKLKALMGKNITMDDLIGFMAEVTIKEVEKKKFKQTDLPKSKNAPLPPAEVNMRTPRAAVKRKVYKRDKSCTQCGSLHRLNYDHREAYALGGNSELNNIRLLCFNCNQRVRIRMKL